MRSENKCKPKGLELKALGVVGGGGLRQPWRQAHGLASRVSGDDAPQAPESPWHDTTLPWLAHFSFPTRTLTESISYTSLWVGSTRCTRRAGEVRRWMEVRAVGMRSAVVPLVGLGCHGAMHPDRETKTRRKAMPGCGHPLDAPCPHCWMPEQSSASPGSALQGMQQFDVLTTPKPIPGQQHG